MECLRAWELTVRASENIAGALTELTAGYLGDRPRALSDTELYVAAIRRPELRPLSRLWFDGLVRLLSEYATPEAATAAAFLIDGAIIRALSTNDPLDTPALSAGLRRLLRP